MTRRRVHFIFGCATLAFALLAAYEGFQLQQAHRANSAISGAAEVGIDTAVPEGGFAHALALSREGDTQGAIQAYKQVIRSERADLSRAAHYNLGNVYLRESLKQGIDAVAHSLPLIELAKQSYREVLRADPEHWDARYNLERALWLAPEYSSAAVEEGGREIWSEDLLRASQSFRVDLP